MHEIIAQLLSYSRGIWRYRWYMIACAWVICIIGWTIVARMPDVYKASARVHVDTHSVLQPLLRGLAVSSNVNAQVALMTRTLLSRPNLEKVARMTDMDIKAKDDNKMDELIDGLKNNIKIGKDKRSSLFSISYENSDPKLAKSVVQSLLTLFVEGALGDSRRDSDSAEQFLDKQLKEYESKLIEAEEKLKEFKREHVGMMPGKGKDFFQQLEKEIEELDQAKLQLKESENRRDELKRQISGEVPGLMLLPGSEGGTSPKGARIQNLEMQLDELLLKYTSNHPDVISLKQTIAKLKAEQKKEIAELKEKGLGASPVDNNPVYQQMKIALSSAEANVATLSVRVEEYTKRVEKMQTMIHTMPQIEADLKSLNRDYSINKKKYEEILARRESAKISRKVEQSADNVKFKVIDPPRVPSSPSGPNRTLLMSLVLLVSLGAGTALSLLLYLIKPTFETRQSLTEFTNLPVLGSVSMIWSSAQIQERRMEIMIFGGTGLALIGFYSLLLIYNAVVG
ncbi:MAG: Wzz/FepE/Etk N-terminal domain-containing protein [Gammaproteobacteria bacterium]|nr:Wzz/FepE/Etk N-terminal domain-containing protein [Gammaproteobacteria bacterium]